MSRQRSYRVAPGVRWVVERRGLLLVGDDSHLRVGYPEAAIWDLLSRGYETRALVDALVHIAGVGERAAAELLDETARLWQAAGFLTAESDDG